MNPPRENMTVSIGAAARKEGRVNRPATVKRERTGGRSEFKNLNEGRLKEKR